MRDLVSDFKQLPSALTESNPLHGILQSLSPYEWRDLHALLATRTFQCDIIGNLPIELVVAIFNELDVVASLVCRRVCVRWRDLLNAEFQRIMLHGWVSPNDPLLEGEAALAPVGACNLRAEHIQAVINHRPFRIARYIILDYKDPSATLPAYDFAVDTFAWIRERSPGETTVACRNFRTGQEDEFRGEGREAISGLALTSKLIGFLTFSGMCYACDLKTRHMRSLQIPSANVKAFAGRATHLVVMLGSEDSGYTVVFWDYGTQKSTSFDILRQMPSAVRATNNNSTVPPEKHNGILVESDGRSVVVFDQVVSSHETAIKFVRYSPKGDIIKKESLIMEHPFPPKISHSADARAPNRLRLPILPCDNEGNFTLTSFLGMFSRTVMFYNEHTDKLFLHKYDNPESNPESNSDRALSYLRQCSWFVWRRVAYGRLHLNKIGAVLYNTILEPARTFEVLNYKVELSHADKPWATSFFGNNSFILEAQQFGISRTQLILVVQCFEKNILLPKWFCRDRITEVPRKDATSEDDSDEDDSNEDDSDEDHSNKDDSNGDVSDDNEQG